MTSMPLSRMSSSSSRVRPAVPPPKSWRKISPKCWLMTSKASRKRSRDVRSIFLMAWSSSAIESSRSCRCAVRNVWRSSSSCACSTARTFTGPMRSSRSRISWTCDLEAGDVLRAWSSSVSSAAASAAIMPTAWWHSRAEVVEVGRRCGRCATSSSVSASRSISRSRRRSLSACLAALQLVAQVAHAVLGHRGLAGHAVALGRAPPPAAAPTPARSAAQLARAAASISAARRARGGDAVLQLLVVLRERAGTPPRPRPRARAARPARLRGLGRSGPARPRRRRAPRATVARPARPAARCPRVAIPLRGQQRLLDLGQADRGRAALLLGLRCARCRARRALRCRRARSSSAAARSWRIATSSFSAAWIRSSSARASAVAASAAAACSCARCRARRASARLDLAPGAPRPRGSRAAARAGPSPRGRLRPSSRAGSRRPASRRRPGPAARHDLERVLERLHDQRVGQRRRGCASAWGPLTR